MKKRFLEILTLSLILFLCISSSGLAQSTSIKKDKRDVKKSSPYENDMFGIKEEMPRFPGCEDQNLSKSKLEKCSKETLIAFVYNNLEYPKQAVEKGIEGRSIVQFYLDIDGKMKDVKLARGFDEACDKAALDVVKKMQSEFIWIPGKQRGRLVKVLYTLPIKFEKSTYLNPIKLLPPVTDAPPPPPPPPPLPPVVDEVIYVTNRDVPIFKGCENLNLNDKELEKCSKEGILSYIYDNLVYPEEAKENCTEGMVVVQFVLDKFGDLHNIRLVKDIGDGCGEAVLKVLDKIRDENLWIPASESSGKARGRPAKTQYTIPVKFKWDYK